MLRFGLFVTIAVLSAACTPTRTPRLPGGLTRAEFVEVMQALELAHPAARQSLLEKHRTSEAEIRAFISALAEDPVALSATLDSVQVRVDRLRRLGVQAPLQ
ncbi:MAG: hypothetical protein ACT443_03605 [Gemmatimonadota bacterium]